MTTEPSRPLDELLGEIERVCDKITRFGYRLEDDLRKKTPPLGRPEKLGGPELFELVKDGRTYREIAEVLHLSVPSVSHIIKREGLREFRREQRQRRRKEFPYLNSPLLASRRQELEESVSAGLTQKQIGNLLGVTKERARQLLHESGLYHSWVGQHQELKSQRAGYQIQLQAERQLFVNTLRQLEEIVAPASPWVEVKVWQYRNLRSQVNSNAFSKDQLFKLFEAYATTFLQGRKLSCYELGEIAGIYFVSTARVLREVGLDSMYGNLDRHYTPKWKKEALERCFSLPFGPSTFAYFLQVKPKVACGHFAKVNQTPPSKRKQAVKYFSSGKMESVLTYPLASQIYEAQDLGFSQEETADLLDTQVKVVDYARENRREIGKDLIGILRTIYLEESINTPYRWKK